MVTLETLYYKEQGIQVTISNRDMVEYHVLTLHSKEEFQNLKMASLQIL